MTDHPRQDDLAYRCRRLSVQAEPSRLRDVRRFVDEIAIEAALDAERTFDLKVAVSEACANAVEHSRMSPALDICAHIRTDRIIVEISDRGDFHVPPATHDRTRRSRGLGLPLMVALMDEVRFHRLPGGGTTVALCLLRPTRGLLEGPEAPGP